MTETNFNGSELLLMYFVMKSHIAENNDLLDSGECDAVSRDGLLENNKLANSVVRKIRHILLSNGVNPEDLIDQA